MCTRGRVLKRQLETTNWEALVGVFKHGLRTAATAVMSTVCEPMIALGVGKKDLLAIAMGTGGVTKLY
jgi:hypothetical protein